MKTAVIIVDVQADFTELNHGSLVVPGTDQHYIDAIQSAARRLKQEGYYSVYSSVGARTEIPGCSLCMGNQARVRPGATILSTSTRNFDNRMGDGAMVYLGSAELAAITALSGRLPGPEEYFQLYREKIEPFAAEIYRYHEFDKLERFAMEYERISEG